MTKAVVITARLNVENKLAMKGVEEVAKEHDKLNKRRKDAEKELLRRQERGLRAYFNQANSGFSRLSSRAKSIFGVGAAGAGILGGLALGNANQGKEIADKSMEITEFADSVSTLAVKLRVPLEELIGVTKALGAQGVSVDAFQKSVINFERFVEDNKDSIEGLTGNTVTDFLNFLKTFGESNYQLVAKAIGEQEAQRFLNVITGDKAALKKSIDISKRSGATRAEAAAVDKNAQLNIDINQRKSESAFRQQVIIAQRADQVKNVVFDQIRFEEERLQLQIKNINTAKEAAKAMEKISQSMQDLSSFVADKLLPLVVRLIESFETLISSVKSFGNFFSGWFKGKGQGK